MKDGVRRGLHANATLLQYLRIVRMMGAMWEVSGWEGSMQQRWVMVAW